jgi:hypothetical protein
MLNDCNFFYVKAAFFTLSNKMLSFGITSDNILPPVPPACKNNHYIPTQIFSSSTSEEHLPSDVCDGIAQEFLIRTLIDPVHAT